jgi:hypothetical protein
MAIKLKTKGEVAAGREAPPPHLILTSRGTISGRFDQIIAQMMNKVKELQSYSGKYPKHYRYER